MSSISAGKIAIVTGAGSGIGRATALALLRANWSVALAGRRREMLDETCSLAEGHQQRAVVVPTDVGKAADVRALFARTREAFGRLDLLFNNAGINVPAVPFEDLTLEQWRQVLEVNVTGAFLCAQEAFRWMKQQQPQGGRIINNGSISADTPRPRAAPYTASKHAISGLTKSLALDGRKYHIACGQIDVGNAETELAAQQKQGVLQANGQIASEPMMDVQHVAQAVLHMASLPLEANILRLTVMATAMPFVGRG